MTTQPPSQPVQSQPTLGPVQQYPAHEPGSDGKYNLDIARAAAQNAGTVTLASLALVLFCSAQVMVQPTCLGAIEPLESGQKLFFTRTNSVTIVRLHDLKGVPASTMSMAELIC